MRRWPASIRGAGPRDGGCGTDGTSDSNSANWAERLFLNLLRTLRAGESAYTAFVDAIRTPPILYVNLVLFALLVWHAVTWFMLIGKAQPIQFTERPLPWKAVFGVNVLLWIGVSGAVVYLIFGGF